MWASPMTLSGNWILVIQRSAGCLLIQFAREVVPGENGQRRERMGGGGVELGVFLRGSREGRRPSTRVYLARSRGQIGDPQAYKHARFSYP